MAGKDIEAALLAVKPKTNAAKIRQVMPVIEKQLAAGVTREAILEVLKAQGIEVSLDTLKSYLYRYRKAQRERGQSRPNGQGGGSVSAPVETVATQEQATENGGVSYDTDRVPEQSPALLGPAELSRLMNPGDDQNAQDLAKYESVGRNRRKQT